MSVTYDRKEIEAKGFVHLETWAGPMPSLGEMQRAAIDHDYKHSNITAFRLSCAPFEEWALFAKPGSPKGYVAEALLP